MAAREQALRFHAKTDKRIVCTVDDANGAPVILTGGTITWKLSRSSGSEALVTASVGSGITISDQSISPGEFIVVLAAASTTGYSGKYYHEARVTLGGAAEVVCYGPVTVLPSLG